MANLVVHFETHAADPQRRKREWDPDNVFHVNPNIAP
jgi:hypothetical protein